MVTSSRKEAKEIRAMRCKLVRLPNDAMACEWFSPMRFKGVATERWCNRGEDARNRVRNIWL